MSIESKDMRDIKERIRRNLLPNTFTVRAEILYTLYMNEFQEEVITNPNPKSLIQLSYLDHMRVVYRFPDNIGPIRVNIKKMLELLINQGLIEKKSEDCYIITDRGIQAVESYTKGYLDNTVTNIGNIWNGDYFLKMGQFLGETVFTK